MTPEELVSKVQDGTLRLHELEEHAQADVAATARRRFIEAESDTDLETIGSYDFPAETATSNIENLVGAAQIPLGIVGPIPVDGLPEINTPYLPLATTEGALVASVNRGCAAIRAAGGATVRVLQNAMTRAPVFRVDDVAMAADVADWVRCNQDHLATVAESTTSHGEVHAVTPYVVGDNVFLRFEYGTKDAMGMNMATIATEAACDIVESETGAELIALSGNLCSDKKPAAINAIQGRGRTVAADVQIPADIVESYLKTTPDAIAEANRRKNLVGSIKSVSLGANAHAANTIAAAFVATGQDVAQVVEGSNAITTADVRDDGSLYASLTCASLEVGTVGGGTGLPTQTEALNILGLHGGGDPPGANADALAKIIATAALAGELSLLGALAADHLASAHEELGR